jgi:hypothetical protein
VVLKEGSCALLLGHNKYTGNYWKYKVLVSLLYGEHDGIRRLGSGEVVVHHSTLAAYFGIKNEKLLIYIDRLVEMGLIISRTKAYGKSVLHVRAPIDWE